jgi:hypothetical protein
MLAMCLYTSTAVKTAHGMHVVTVLLAGGQIGFLYLYSKLRLVPALILSWLFLGTSKC